MPKIQKLYFRLIVYNKKSSDLLENMPKSLFKYNLNKIFPQLSTAFPTTTLKNYYNIILHVNPNQ